MGQSRPARGGGIVHSSIHDQSINRSTIDSIIDRLISERDIEHEDRLIVVVVTLSRRRRIGSSKIESGSSLKLLTTTSMIIDPEGSSWCQIDDDDPWKWNACAVVVRPTKEHEIELDGRTRIPTPTLLPPLKHLSQVLIHYASHSHTEARYISMRQTDSWHLMEHWIIQWDTRKGSQQKYKRCDNFL